jgi:hypothetical protein
VEQDVEMRRSLAARTIKMKIDQEDAQLGKPPPKGRSR